MLSATSQFLFSNQPSNLKTFAARSSAIYRRPKSTVFTAPSSTLGANGFPWARTTSCFASASSRTRTSSKAWSSMPATSRRPCWTTEGPVINGRSWKGRWTSRSFGVSSPSLFFASLELSGQASGWSRWQGEKTYFLF